MSWEAALARLPPALTQQIGCMLRAFLAVGGGLCLFARHLRHQWHGKVGKNYGVDSPSKCPNAEICFLDRAWSNEGKIALDRSGRTVFFLIDEVQRFFQVQEGTILTWFSRGPSVAKLCQDDSQWIYICWCVSQGFPPVAKPRP